MQILQEKVKSLPRSMTRVSTEEVPSLHELSTLVLRFSKADGEHIFRVAKMETKAIRNLSDRIAEGASWEDAGVFGPPLNLSEALREMDTRDFAVLDIKGNTFD